MDVLIINGIQYRLYNRLYAVSRDGVVLKVNTQTIVEPKIRKDGYAYVASKFLIHRMVGTCWLPRPNKAREIHHINEVKAENHADNLMWVSHKEHIGDHHDFGRYERTEETRQKLREYRTGRKTSEGTKLKQRLANLSLGIRPPPRLKGYKVPDEQIAPMRENHWRNTSCEIDGIAYRSFAEAGRVLGMRSLTIRKRCLATTFPNFKVVRD